MNCSLYCGECGLRFNLPTVDLSNDTIHSDFTSAIDRFRGLRYVEVEHTAERDIIFRMVKNKEDSL